MNKKLHVGVSPITNEIYCGTVLRDGRTWGANKTEVTNEVICAFADHALTFKKREGKDIILSIDGKPVIRIEVIDLQESDSGSQ